MPNENLDSKLEELGKRWEAINLQLKQIARVPVEFKLPDGDTFSFEKIDRKWAVCCNGRPVTDLPIEDRIDLLQWIPDLKKVIIDRNLTLDTELQQALDQAERILNDRT